MVASCVNDVDIPYRRPHSLNLHKFKIHITGLPPTIRMSLFAKMQSLFFLSPSAAEPHASAEECSSDFQIEPSFRDCLITLIFLMAILESLASLLSALSKSYPELFDGESSNKWWQEDEAPAERAARVQRCLTVSIYQAENDQQDDDHNCCSICLNDFEQGETLASGSRKCCNNLYHTSCLSSWLQLQSTCPCCRQDMLVSISATPGAAKQLSSSSADNSPRILSTSGEVCRFI